MLLAWDVGNTNTVLGLYDGQGWLGRWRLRLNKAATVDECAVAVRAMLGLADCSLNQVKGMALASVVPSLTQTLTAFGRHYLDLEPVIVGPDVCGLKIGYHNPKTLGADRIATAVAAFDRYPQALLVVDFGTATKFDYLSPEGEFVGGLIAPGLMITGEALFQRTAQLPQVDILGWVDELIAKDTVSAITAGLFRGYLCMVEGLITQIKAEAGGEPKVVATGGLAPVLAAHSQLIEVVEPWLTLEGVRLIHQRVG